jgi:CRP-like cAMP-binding protein
MDLAHNAFIDRLPVSVRQRLVAQCETVSVVLTQVLCDADETLTHAYFPLNCWVSLVAQLDTQPGLEVGMVGREGMLGAELVLGPNPSPWCAMVQGAGTCLRLEAASLRNLAAKLPALQRQCCREVLLRLDQLSRAAACERFHQIGPRLARWLLMSHDRAQANTFFVTQEFMALMLGVRRVGVTIAASHLQRQGLITYHRGVLTVLNRPALELAACSCYSSDQAAYKRLVANAL